MRCESSMLELISKKMSFMKVRCDVEHDSAVLNAEETSYGNFIHMMQFAGCLNNNSSTTNRLYCESSIIPNAKSSTYFATVQIGFFYTEAKDTLDFDTIQIKEYISIGSHATINLQHSQNNKCNYVESSKSAFWNDAARISLLHSLAKLKIVCSPALIETIPQLLNRNETLAQEDHVCIHKKLMKRKAVTT